MARPLTFASFLAPSVRPVYEFITRTVGNRLGCHSSLISGSSFLQFEKGQIDIAFLCSPPYLRLASRGLVEAIAAPVLLGGRYGGRPVYFSDVVVRNDNPARNFKDLRGSRWSFNDVDSYSGYTAPLLHLARLGETAAFFGRWIDSGSHEASIRLILSGEVDASAIDSQVLAIEARRPEVAAGLRTICVLGPAPVQPIVIASRLPENRKERVREIILGLGSDPAGRKALETGLVERFVPVSRATYEPVRVALAGLDSGQQPCTSGTSVSLPFQSIGL
ncbi:MAG TPA: PhnD/SsuA/transferrin family substrate-binding protein [Candidatus Dormibacteraeota bacterium]